jgi:hypothetical protein
MNDRPSPPAVPDQVPSQSEGARAAVPFGWGDYLMIVGAVVTVGMMLVTTVGTTYPWHFAVLGAGLAAFIIGMIRTRAWD